MHSDCILSGVFMELKHEDTLCWEKHVYMWSWLVAFLLHERAHTYTIVLNSHALMHVYIPQRETITTLDYEIVPYDMKRSCVLTLQRDMPLFPFLKVDPNTIWQIHSHR
jgi:hypothetical protein